MQAGVALATEVVQVWHVPVVPHAAAVSPGWQEPDEQHPVEQAVVQVPQWLESVCRFTQTPLHSA
jgi:hypothetical protein